MKKLVFGLCFLLLAAMQSLCFASSASVKGFVYGVNQLSDGQVQMEIIIALNKKPASDTLLSVDQNDVNRLVLNLPRTHFDEDDFSQMTINNRFVHNVLLKKMDHNTQVIINLQKKAGYYYYDKKLIKNEQRHADGKYLLIIKLREKQLPADVSIPLPYVKGKIIVIDPGHGGSDSGAIGPDHIMEKTVTLAVSKKLYNLLIDNGATVKMTRMIDKDVFAPNDSARDELQARVDVAENLPGTDIFVCIHANSFTSPSANGTETYYCAGSSKSKLLAQDVQDNLVAANGLYNRGISTANFYVLKHTSMPAILTELAFISNPREERLLDDPAMQKKMAIGIGKGINEYFRELGGNEK